MSKKPTPTPPAPEAAEKSDDLLTRPVTEDQLKGARSVLNELFGYHQGPRPRLGSRVRCKGEFGTLMGHTTRGDLYVLLDSSARRQFKLSELQWDASPRTSLHAMLLMASAEVRAEPVDVVALFNLSNHFRGDNGSRYADRAAHLWCVRALCLCGVMGSETWRLSRWLNREIEGFNDKAPIPPLMDSEWLARCSAEVRDPSFSKELATEASEAVARALALGEASISLSLSDETFQIDPDGLERRLALDLATERQVVVIGTTRLVQAEGFVQVVDLDTLQSYNRHVSGLEVSEDAVDYGWFWDVLTHSALKHPNGYATKWLAGGLIGPSGEDSELTERRIVAVVASLHSARMLTAQDPANSRRELKRARDLSRTLDRPERNRLIALAPELVAHDTRSIRLGKAESLHQALRTAIEAMLLALPAPAIKVLPSTQSDKSAPTDAQTLSVALEVQVKPDQSAESPTAMARDRIRFTRPSQPLRFSVTEHQLLAMEWQLVDEAGAHDTAVVTTLEWLEQRLGTSLPKTWRDGAHEIDRAGVSVQIEAAPELFAFRLDHPDVEHPTRWWRVEATVLRGRAGNGGMVGLRMHVRDLVDLPAPARTVPALLRAWSAKPGLLLAGARAGHIAQIRDDSQLERLRRIIERRERQSPVLVTAAGGVRLPVQGPLAGLVRVVLVDPTVEGYCRRYGALTEDVVHVFAPREDQPRAFQAIGTDWLERLRSLMLELRQNPKIPTFREIRDSIHAYRAEQLARPSPFWDQLGSDTRHQLHVSEPSDASYTPLPIDISRPDADLAVELADPSLGDKERDHSSLENLKQLVRKEVQDYEELLELAETEREAALCERDSARAELLALRHRVAQLQGNSRHGVAAPAVRPDAPDSLAGLAEWAPSIAPRIAISDKAIRVASRLNHNEVEKIYATLLALHDLYWVMRFSDDEDERTRKGDEWRQFLLQNRLVFSPVGIAARTGRYQDEYRANVDGHTFVASMHVAGSSAHDPMRCLRIYTEVDEDNTRVIVVHLPTHLTNSQT